MFASIKLMDCVLFLSQFHWYVFYMTIIIQYNVSSFWVSTPKPRPSVKNVNIWLWLKFSFCLYVTMTTPLNIPWFLKALLGEQGLPTCRFSVCLCVCVCVCVWWDNFKASDWSKLGDLARRRARSHDAARLLLMVPIEPWRNSTPFFGAAVFCTTKIDDFRTSSTLSSD